MLTGILLLSVIAFIAVTSYRRPRLEQRVFKNVPLIDWINLLVIPTSMYFAVFLIVKNIINRSKVNILDFDELILLAIGFLFLAYAFVGNSIHFVGKVLSRYIPPNKHFLIYQANEIFHGKLSHYLGWVCSSLVVFTIALLEINYPLDNKLATRLMFLILPAGFIIGISAAHSIFHLNKWSGGYSKPLFFLITVQTMIIYSLFKTFKLSYSYYPFNFLVILISWGFITSFVFRKIVIITRLGRKRRFHFLAKIFSP